MVLLVALAVGLGVAVSAQERALRQGSARAADLFPVLIGARGSETQLVLSAVYLQPAALELISGTLLTELAGRSDVAWAAPLGFGDNWNGHPLVGTSVDLIARSGFRLVEGRPFEAVDEAVVGAEVPLALGQSFTATHGQVFTDEEEHHDALAYRVVGRLAVQGTPWDRAILAPVEAVWWIHGLPVGHALDEMLVWPEGPDGEPDLSAIPVGPPWDATELPGVPAIVVTPTSFAGAYAIRSAYRDGERGTLALFPAEVLVRLYAVLGDVRDLVATISVLTQVMVIWAVLLAVIASLAQRRRLIGVLRALGASRGFVFSTIWLYVALSLAAGAALGLPLGLLGATLVSAVFEQRTELTLPVGLGRSEFLLVGVVIGCGLILAAIPAALAYRGSVAAALRA